MQGPLALPAAMGSLTSEAGQKHRTDEGDGEAGDDERIARPRAG